MVTDLVSEFEYSPKCHQLTFWKGGGPDQYDLPSPTAKGAVETPTTPTKDMKANGHIHHEEKEAFEKKTGWAPRFGQGDLTEEEANVSLLDHQTWLESNVDEKFFGGRSI